MSIYKRNDSTVLGTNLFGDTLENFSCLLFERPREILHGLTVLFYVSNYRKKCSWKATKLPAHWTLSTIYTVPAVQTAHFLEPIERFPVPENLPHPLKFANPTRLIGNSWQPVPREREREPGEHTPAVGDTFCNCHTSPRANSCNRRCVFYRINKSIIIYSSPNVLIYIFMGWNLRWHPVPVPARFATPAGLISLYPCVCL